MSFEATRAAIAARMATYTDNPVAQENHEFTPPTDGTPWVRLNIIEGDSDIAGLGGAARLFRNTGVIICQVFTQEGKGTKEALDIADVLETLWSGASFNGITCRASSVARVGASGGWYQVNITTPYYWDDIK